MGWFYRSGGVVLSLSALTACGDLNTAAGTAQTVQGDVVVPPAAGTAQFLGLSGAGAPFALADAVVTSNGRFQLTLPAQPAQLPTRSNTELLPYSPSPELLEYREFTCGTSPTASDAGGRVVLVRLGNYRVGGQLTGQLLPAVTSVSGTTSVSRKVSTELYAYADRNFTVQGNLNCILRDMSGVLQPVPVQVNYDLKRGWNRLTVQSILNQAGELTVNAVASTVLDGVQWRYLPITP